MCLTRLLVPRRRWDRRWADNEPLSGCAASVADADATAKTRRSVPSHGPARALARRIVLLLPDPALEIVKRCIARAEVRRSEGQDGRARSKRLVPPPLYRSSSSSSANRSPETRHWNAADSGVVARSLRAKPKALKRIVKDPVPSRRVIGCTCSDLGFSAVLAHRCDSLCTDSDGMA